MTPAQKLSESIRADQLRLATCELSPAKQQRLLRRIQAGLARLAFLNDLDELRDVALNSSQRAVAR